MATFNITINAKPIFDRKITVTGLARSVGWLDAEVEQSFTLEPGTYGIGVPSCQSQVKFQITPDGLVTYDDRLKGCLAVGEGNRLTVNGLPVTLDARYVAMSRGKGVLLGAGGLTKDDWIVHRSINLLPGSSYHVEQGSATVSSFVFQLRHDGRFEYDPGYDLSRGGFLGGHNTSTLVFRGYPFLLDATAVGEHLNFFNVTGFDTAHNGVLFANLLPMQVPFMLGFSGGSLVESAGLGVKVSPDGSVELVPPGTVCAISRDDFHGVPRLMIVKR